MVRLSRRSAHPGEILDKEFLRPMRVKRSSLPDRILGIVSGTCVVTAADAKYLANKFNTTSQFWLNLQEQYDRG